MQLTNWRGIQVKDWANDQSNVDLISKVVFSGVIYTIHMTKEIVAEESGEMAKD